MTEVLLRILEGDVRGALTYVRRHRDGVDEVMHLRPVELRIAISRLHTMEQLVKQYAADPDGTAGEEALHKLTQLVKS